MSSESWFCMPEQPTTDKLPSCAFEICYKGEQPSQKETLKIQFSKASFISEECLLLPILPNRMLLCKLQDLLRNSPSGKSLALWEKRVIILTNQQRITSHISGNTIQRKDYLTQTNTGVFTLLGIYFMRQRSSAAKVLQSWRALVNIKNKRKQLRSI